MNPGHPDRSHGSLVLVLVVNVFPFDRGEEFLEAELPFLAREFAAVLILPLSRTAEMRRTRPIPENVRVVDAAPDTAPGAHPLLQYARRHPLRAIAAMMRALGSGFPRVEHMVQDLKFDLMASLVADRYLGALCDTARSGARIVFYSYWMMRHARVALVLRSRLRLRDAPVVSRAHGWDMYEERSPNGRLPQRALLLRQLREVYPVSRHGLKHLTSQHPKYRRKIMTQRLGVHAAKNSAVYPGYPSRDSALVYSCSSLIPLKRLPLLIDGIAEAQRRGLPLRWHHIGTGSAAQCEAVHAYALSKLQPESFRLLGAMSNAAVRDTYARYPGAVFVNVSASEGAPVSIMEALAQGLPAIATAVGGNAELVDAGQGMFPGLISSHPTPAEIADRLMSLFSVDPAAYAAFVQAAVNHWRAHWSATANFSRFSKRLAGLAIEHRG